jgi:hypothetical protein
MLKRSGRKSSFMIGHLRPPPKRKKAASPGRAPSLNNIDANLVRSIRVKENAQRLSNLAINPFLPTAQPARPFLAKPTEWNPAGVSIGAQDLPPSSE